MPERSNTTLDPATLTPAIIELQQTDAESVLLNSSSAITALAMCYSEVTLGVRAAIQQGIILEPLARSPIHVGGIAIKYSTYLEEFSPDPAKAIPSYIREYQEARSRALYHLLKDASTTKNFSLLLDAAHAFNDPGIALGFFYEIYADKVPERFGRMSINMNRERYEEIFKGINRRRITLRDALKQYGKNQYTQLIEEQRSSGELGQIETVFTGLSRTLGVGSKRYIRDQVITPLEDIAAQPPVSEQIMAREKSRMNPILGADT